MSPFWYSQLRIRLEKNKGFSKEKKGTALSWFQHLPPAEPTIPLLWPRPVGSGGAGVSCPPPQISTDQVTLTQPGGTDYANHITTPQIFRPSYDPVMAQAADTVCKHAQWWIFDCSPMGKLKRIMYFNIWKVVSVIKSCMFCASFQGQIGCCGQQWKNKKEYIFVPF